jgi:hypothetical protein
MINIIQFLRNVEEISKKVATTIPSIIATTENVVKCIEEVRSTFKKSN